MPGKAMNRAQVRTNLDRISFECCIGRISVLVYRRDDLAFQQSSLQRHSFAKATGSFVVTLSALKYKKQTSPVRGSSQSVSPSAKTCPSNSAGELTIPKLTILRHASTLYAPLTR
jgi:hypothetical protein